MRGKFYKPLLLVSSLLLLGAAAQFQRVLNGLRSDPKLGLMRVTDLGSNAPPVLAFTTVALGGFRGLIANALWIRASDLQDKGKYFEMVQLADWITKLEPSFAQVWLVQSWNMAFNISVKFTDYADRWRWVQRGIELLRDQGLRYNATEALVYRELAWFFQFKMGATADDAHLYYKTAWAKEMNQVLGSGHPNFDELLAPKTDDTRKRAALLRDKYKMEPAEMKEVDQLYGPLEWRLPEAHAIYWASIGLKRAKKKDLITLRRVIYQSMHTVALRGRLISVDPIYYDADLDKVDRANSAYEKMMAEDTEMRDVIKRAHRNFLRETVYQLYTHNRLAEADKLFRLLKQNYPDVVPADKSLEQYALEKLAGNLSDASNDRMKVIIEGAITKHFINLALGDEGQAEGFDRMARQLWTYYDDKIKVRREPLKFPPLPEMKRTVLEKLTGPETRFNPELVARLRARFSLPPPATNALPPQLPGTSSPSPSGRGPG